MKRMVTLQQSSVESCKDNWMGLENMLSKNITASNYDYIERNDKKTKKRKIDDIIDSKEDQYETIQEDIVMQCSSNVLTDKSTDLTKDLGNLQITRRDWSSLQQKLTHINDVIVTIPDVFASQATILEENLCLNVTEKVKEVMKGKCELFVREIDVIHREISFIKRVLKFSSKNEASGAEEDEEEEDNEWLRKI